MKKEIYTTWAPATTNASKAMISLLSCLESGKNAWIEIRKNGEQSIPIKKKNPELDNPFNWVMQFGVPRDTEAMEKHHYFNETERDLTYNWIACFGELKAVEEYQQHGTITKELFKGCGICHPVRIEDANYYRKNIVGDDYHYEYWMNYWRPKDNIPYWVVDDSIGDVFTICFTNEHVDKAESIRKAAQFMADYADTL